MLYIGTAGFSYPDWVGVFYPESLSQKDFLLFYAQKFSCVELDYTYYRQPSAKTMAAMVKKVPSDFRFTIKAHKTLTHEIAQGDEYRKEFEVYMQGISPVIESGKLGCVLFQFPWSFKPNEKNLDYVLSLKKKMPSIEIVAEFRNSQWAKEGVYQALRKENIGFCAVDEPPLRGLFPKVAEVTSKVGYVRFHGRNSAKWFNHEKAWERYDYLYTDDELKEWIPKIATMESLASDTYVMYNNCHRGEAAINAQRMKELLGLAGSPGLHGDLSPEKRPSQVETLDLNIPLEKNPKN